MPKLSIGRVLDRRSRTLPDDKLERVIRVYWSDRARQEDLSWKLQDPDLENDPDFNAKDLQEELEGIERRILEVEEMAEQLDFVEELEDGKPRQAVVEPTRVAHRQEKVRDVKRVTVKAQDDDDEEEYTTRRSTWGNTLWSRRPTYRSTDKRSATSSAAAAAPEKVRTPLKGEPRDTDLPYHRGLGAMATEFQNMLLKTDPEHDPTVGDILTDVLNPAIGMFAQTGGALLARQMWAGRRLISFSSTHLEEIDPFHLEDD